MDFPDGSTFTLNRKLLSLVAEDEGTAAADATSEHRHVGKRAKTRAPSKEKEDAAEEESEESEEGSDKEEDERSDSDYGEKGEEDEDDEHRHARKRAKARAPSKGKKRAAPAGARTSKAAKAAKKTQKTSASACQVRSERNTATANVARTGCQPTQRGSQKSNVVTHDSNRRHRQGGGLRSIRGFTEMEETGCRQSR